MKINFVLQSLKTSRAKRVGRGIGSGKGKTCGRGVKGQSSRTGVSLALLEGCQQSFLRALPKRGFNPIRKTRIAIVSLSQIASLIQGKEDGATEITKRDMFEFGLIRKIDDVVKLLSSDREFNLNVKIQYDMISKSAKLKLDNIDQ